MVRKGNLFLENINKQPRLKIDLISFQIMLKCSDNYVVSLKGKAKTAWVFSLTWKSWTSQYITLTVSFTVFNACFGHSYSISYYNACYCYVLLTLSLNSVCLGFIALL